MDFFQEAENAIRFYQNLTTSHSDYLILQIEMKKVQRAFQDEEAKAKFKWSDLKVKPASRAIIIGIVFAAFSQFTGCFALLQYTATIFEQVKNMNDVHYMENFQTVFRTARIASVIERFGNHRWGHNTHRFNCVHLFSRSNWKKGI